MNIQITVRLPVALVQFVDETVTAGLATSRAAVVAQALERERRRVAAEREVEILAKLDGDPYPDLAELHAWSAAHRPQLD